MRRKGKLLFGIFIVLLFVIIVPVYAEGKAFVYDEYHVLTDTEKQALNTKLSKIYDTYGFEAVLYVTLEDVYMDARNYAAAFMRENQIGCGEMKDGMCLFHQPDQRSIAIVFRGRYQDSFTIEIQDLILDKCIAEIKEDNLIEAYESVIVAVENGLKRVGSGKEIRPLDIDGEGVLTYAVKWLVYSFAIMFIPVLILVLVQVAKMKNRKPQKNADFYAPEESFELEMCRDIYLRTEVRKIKIERDKGNSGSSGSFHSNGERFSGSSRKY